jgi:hypothetical protein
LTKPILAASHLPSLFKRHMNLMKLTGSQLNSRMLDASEAFLKYTRETDPSQWDREFDALRKSITDLLEEYSRRRIPLEAEPGESLW